MIQEAMEDINRKKYKNYKIYLHNFSKFDGMFLITHLAKFGYCKPVIHKGKLISCKFHLWDSNYNITIMDSYLLIPSSLRKLTKSFDVVEGKGIFPFLLNNVYYLGFVPDYKYFIAPNVSIDEYNLYAQNWGSNSINLELLEQLLEKDSNLQFHQSKWFKYIDKGSISVLEQLYTLKVTGNKRELIYKNSILEGTCPFKLRDGNLS
jgi:hypothetical protein